MTKVIGGKIPPKEHAKLQLEDRANAILDRLLYAKPKFFKGVRQDCMYRPSDLGLLWLHLPGEDGKFLQPGDIDSPDFLGWPLSFGFTLPESGTRDGLLTTGFRSITPKELRGKVRHVGKFNIEWRTGTLSPNLEFQGAHFYGMWSNGKWLHNVSNIDSMSRPDDGISMRMHLSFSVALTYRYVWGAQFSVGGAKAIVPVTPAGVLELFNDRDKPDDRDRRAALRHWVNSYLRKKPLSEDDFVEVRAHLRGQFDFRWRGFDVRIVPSQYDIDRSK